MVLAGMQLVPQHVAQRAEHNLCFGPPLLPPGTLVPGTTHLTKRGNLASFSPLVQPLPVGSSQRQPTGAGPEDSPWEAFGAVLKPPQMWSQSTMPTGS